MKLLILLLFFQVSFPELVNAQKTDTVTKLESYAHKIDTFSKYFPHEKIYLHFDNTGYFLGDSIWFKAHLVNAAHHIPDNWSRTLYVELLTQEGDIITTKKYKVTDGQCHGFLALKDTLWAGFYEVRAYTRWMINFGEGHEFSRVFPVFDAPREEGDFSRVMSQRNFDVPDYRKKNIWKREKKSDKISLEFFPEGGHWVKGLPSRIAFKAVDRDTGDLNVSGRVYDAQGNDIINFSTVHNGMGVFEFIPGSGIYTAELNIGGKIWKFPLPAVEDEGCTLKTDVFNKKIIHLVVRRSPHWKTESLGITVMCRGQLYCMAELPPSGEESQLVAFSRDDLPSGVSQITLFNSAGEVLAERLVFVNHRDGLDIEIRKDKDTYPPFGKINLDINIKDHRNHPVETGFSLAVRDAEKSVASRAADIRTYLLLSSEIRGYVRNPDYYFESDSRERQYALDLLLMTQGWSRYVWKRLAGIETFKISQPAEENISMDGVVREYSLRFKPVGNAGIRMWMIGNGESYRQKTTTDENGNFIFAFDFWGEQKLSIEVKKNSKRKNCDIRFNRFFAPPLHRLSFYEKQVPSENLTRQKVAVKDTVVIYRPGLFEKRSKGDIAKNYTLKEVKVKRKRTYRSGDERLLRASVVYDLDRVLDKQKDQGNDKSVDLFDFLVRNNPYYSTDRPFDKWHDRYKGRKVVYAVNNIWAEGYTIPLEEIGLERIKLIAIDETMGAAYNINGDVTITHSDAVVIHVYVDHRLRISPKGIRTTIMEGYSLVKEFYNPSYDRTILPGETDYRRTLYWNPDVRTDSKGQAQISFYNNSTCRQIDISAETITLNGQIGTN